MQNSLSRTVSGVSTSVIDHPVGSPLEALLETAGDVAVHFDSEARIKGLSRSAAKRYPAGGLEPGKEFLELFEQGAHDELTRIFEDVLVNDVRAEFMAPFVFAPSRSIAWKLCRYTQEGERGVLAVAQDVTAQKETEYRLSQAQKFDTVTSLPNRVSAPEIYKRLSGTLTGTDRALSFSILAVSGLSRVNSALGSLAGDTLLRHMASRIEAASPGLVILVRLGSKEFGVFTVGPSDKELLVKSARQIASAASAPYFLEKEPMHVKVRVGLTKARPDSSFDEVFSAATKALKCAKEFSQVYFVDIEESGVQEARDTMRLESALHQGMRDGELYLVYQPLFTERGMYGVEALMRWKRADGSEVSPGRFIPVAESNGLIQILGEWALKRASYEIASLNRKLGVALQASVNVSPVQFLNKGFSRSVESALAASGLPPELLQLEITEGTLMAEPELAEGLLRSLQSLGVKIAVDDFGTGYSSLAYLKKFALNTLKIDRSFVKDLPDNEMDLAVCAAISDMASKLKLKVVAEGIETEAQFNALKSVISNGRYQGYYFGRPAALSDIEARCLNGQARKIKDLS